MGTVFDILTIPQTNHYSTTNEHHYKLFVTAQAVRCFTFESQYSVQFTPLDNTLSHDRRA